jgi:DNA-binding response OmpR family regulator
LPKSFDILVVDDSPSDGDIFQAALQEAAPGVTAHWVDSGEKAIRYLNGNNGKGCPVRLVFLDWNMPLLNGWETLRQIREGPNGKVVPIVLLSSACGKADVKRAYQSGANAYFKKPMSFDEYIDRLRMLVNHWLRFAELPD